MGANRISQEQLADLMGAEKLVREAAGVVASSEDTEPGELVFSRSAYDQLQRVPPLVEISVPPKSQSPISAAGAAREALRSATDDFTSGTNRSISVYFNRAIRIGYAFTWAVLVYWFRAGIERQHRLTQ